MFTINIDYGANSAPALVVRSADGAEFVGAVVGYPSGDEGVLLDESDHHVAAENAMTSLAPKRYDAISEHPAVYNKLYALYRQLHYSFGGLNKSIDLSRFMKALIEIKYAQQG